MKGGEGLYKPGQGIENVVKRELIRAAITRFQTRHTEGMANLKYRGEDIRYDDVEETLNVPYVNRDEIPLAMDIFKPVVPPGTKLPVIVTIHGGGLALGDRSISRPFARLLAHKGYLVFSLEYRLVPQANVCEELDDICAGLDTVGRLLHDYDLDYTRFFLAAESAGAYLAIYVAAMKQSERLQDAIGYEPSRMVFKALGLNCGMFYTNRFDPCGWLLSEQIYGSMRSDENFLQYMNPEHPEIVDNLPSVFLSTCQGDFLNDYSLRYGEALKKAGKTSRLVYYPDKDLVHAYTTMQTYHPKTLDCIDKMLAFFEEQAAILRARRENDPKNREVLVRLRQRIEDGSINEQNVWRYVKEMTLSKPETARHTALIDCARTYSYEQMYAAWESYARVFTALGMTGKEGARVAIAGTISAEPLFAFYGLNMTGAEVSMFSYPDFLPEGDWISMARHEHITDLVLSDSLVTPLTWGGIVRAKETLGLRNVILLHSRLGGPCVGPAELVYVECNYQALRRTPQTMFMDDLIRKYQDTPFYMADNNVDHIAVITHSYGSAKGARKALPYTERAVNLTASNFKDGFRGELGRAHAGRQLRIAPCFDFSSFLCLCGIVNAHLAEGESVVLTYFGFLHPKFIRAVRYYRVDVLFASGFMLDGWMRRKDIADDAFAPLGIIACGGSHLTSEQLGRYEAFAKKHGFQGVLARSYGVAATGGVQIIAPNGYRDDILGFPSPKENFLVRDETDGRFYPTDGGVRTGVLYISSNSMALNVLDGEKLFDYTEIEGRNFICTNDLVRVNEDGSLSYAGRSERYFANNEGIRFAAGLVEAEMMKQPGIRQCAVVPVLDKRIHDTVPVLYVVPEKKDAEAESVKKALEAVFLAGKLLAKTALPTQFQLVDEIPRAANGRIDVYRITRERMNGVAYDIVPVLQNGKTVGIRVERNEMLLGLTGGNLPRKLQGRSALGLYEALNAGVEDNTPPNPFDPLDHTILALKWLAGRMPWAGRLNMQPPKPIVEMGNDIVGALFGKRNIDHYFEA